MAGTYRVVARIHTWRIVTTGPPPFAANKQVAQGLWARDDVVSSRAFDRFGVVLTLEG